MATTDENDAAKTKSAFPFATLSSVLTATSFGSAPFNYEVGSYERRRDIRKRYQEKDLACIYVFFGAKNSP